MTGPLGTARRTLVLLAFLALGAWVVPDRSAGAATPGSGASAWGIVPPPDSASVAALPGKPQPAWEKIANFPYNVVALPLKGLALGVEETVEFVDESPTLKRLMQVYPIIIGPAVITGGVSAGTGDGFGGNISVDARDLGPAHHALKLRLSGETRGERRTTLALRLRRSELSWFDLGTGYRSDHNSRFYGIGPDTDEESASYYRREAAWVGVTWQRRIGNGDFGWGLSSLYSSVEATGTDHSDHPHLSEEFAGVLPFGYRERSEGFGARLDLVHENTDAAGPADRRWRERMRPDRGGLRRASVSWFEGKGDLRVQYWTWRAEAQQFVPMPFSRRALALRGLISRIEDEGDDPVPFQRLLTNDDPDLFRGYRDERFHDLGLLALSAEYRWPVWSLKSANSLGVDAYVFTDVGQAFGEFDEIDTDRITSSWGGGLRLGGNGRFLGRLEVGRSEEDTVFRLRADQVFQFEKTGLFFGRNPVPDR